MNLKDFVSKIREETDLEVLEVYKCEGRCYVAECINPYTRSLLGDFYFISQIDGNDMKCYNPAENPGEFVRIMKTKKSVYRNEEAMKLIPRRR